MELLAGLSMMAFLAGHPTAKPSRLLFRSAAADDLIQCFNQYLKPIWFRNPPNKTITFIICHDLVIGVTAGNNRLNPRVYLLEFAYRFLTAHPTGNSQIHNDTIKTIPASHGFLI